MPIDILMPALSPTMEKGNLAKWLKKEGDVVRPGDVIAEIETDKATMEVEAIDEGVLVRILVPAGTSDVPVNQVIAQIAGEGESRSPVPSLAPSPKAAAALSPATSSPPAPQGGGKPFASPLARRVAKEAGIDIAGLAGSGPHGRVVERDVRAAIAAGAPKAAPATSTAVAPPPAAAPQPVALSPAAPPAAPRPAAPAGLADAAVEAMYAPGSYEVLPHDGMRKIIARRLTESKQTIPHFYLTVDCDLDALLRLRGEINAAAPEVAGKPAYKISVNDLVIKALALALRTVPDANVTWTDNAMLRHRAADVGVAVAIPGGLITPVIRDAAAKPLSQISSEMKDFAARAKARKLLPHEYQGGSTAVSNLGMFGIRDFAAVINPPHATILAVGAGEQRAVVRNGALAIATVMSVTLSTDHRAVDGALGAELLGAFKGYVEKPMSMLV